MSNLLVDGFDWCPSGLSSSERSRLFGANSMYQLGSFGAVPDVTTGRFGFGKALEFSFNTISATTYGGYVFTFDTAQSEGFLGGAAFVYPDMDSNNGFQVAFFDAVNNAHQMSILFGANGTVHAFRGSPETGTSLGVSVAGVFQEDQWFNYEIRGIVDSTGGFIEVRINTKTVLQIPSANTKNTARVVFDSMYIGGYLPVNFRTVHFAVDDLFANDTTGSENNTWGGNLRVKTQFMIANGATNNFSIGGTSPAPTNWQSVLNQVMDDTKFVYDPTVGDKDLYTPDPNLNAPFVRVVQVRMGLRQDDATQRSVKALIRIGTTVYEGSIEFFLNQTYTYYKQKWELSPATGVTFTGTEVNGCQIGVKVQS